MVVESLYRSLSTEITKKWRECGTTCFTTCNVFISDENIIGMSQRMNSGQVIIIIIIKREECCMFSLSGFFLNVKGNVGSKRRSAHSQISWKTERKKEGKKVWLAV